jgi:hypothetical protein
MGLTGSIATLIKTAFLKNQARSPHGLLLARLFFPKDRNHFVVNDTFTLLPGVIATFFSNRAAPLRVAGRCQLNHDQPVC